MNTLYKVDDRSLLASVLNGEGVFLGPAKLLDGLTADQASTKPHPLPHSIADIVAHLCYWQEWWNHCAVGGYPGVPRHAAESWPAGSAGDWDALRTRYLESIEEAKRIAAQSDSLNDSILPPDVPNPVLSKESRGSGLLHAAVHNSHHLGQIITLRQLLGLWPPPAGSMTW